MSTARKLKINETGGIGKNVSGQKVFFMHFLDVADPKKKHKAKFTKKIKSKRLRKKLKELNANR